MPDWWSERRARVKTAIRSLGLDVGDAESVTRRWEEKVNNGISAKADEWRAKRVRNFLGQESSDQELVPCEGVVVVHGHKSVSSCGHQHGDAEVGEGRMGFL